MFQSVLEPGVGERSRRGRLAGATLSALGVHAAALLALGAVASPNVGTQEPVEDFAEGVAVRLVARRAPPPPPPPAGERRASRTVPSRRHRPVSPLVPAKVPAPTREPEPAQPVEEEPVPEAPETERAAEEPASAPGVVGGVAGGVAGGVLGGVLGGGTGGQGGGLLPPPPPPTLTPEQRQALVGRYLQELFRSRIAARFHYPQEAESLGLEGLVVLRVSIDEHGRLLGMEVRGRCPHPVLCEAARRTVRDSVPFPPPPAELGGSVAVDVPFQYRLE